MLMYAPLEWTHFLIQRDKNRNLTAYTKATQKQIFLQKNDQIFPLTLKYIIIRIVPQVRVKKN